MHKIVETKPSTKPTNQIEASCEDEYEFFVDNFNARPSLDEKTEKPISRLVHIIAHDSRIKGGAPELGSAVRTALARLNPDGELHPRQWAALTQAWIYADLEPDTWDVQTRRRWTWITHGIARVGHDASLNFGENLSKVGVFAPRVSRLLCARGDDFYRSLLVFLQVIAIKRVAPNWHELGELILNQGHDEYKAEKMRLKIAGGFYSAEERKSNTKRIKKLAASVNS
jgi:CRISPR system Cascade subunit CasB